MMSLCKGLLLLHIVTRRDGGIDDGKNFTQLLFEQ